MKICSIIALERCKTANCQSVTCLVSLLPAVFQLWQVTATNYIFLQKLSLTAFLFSQQLARILYSLQLKKAGAAQNLRTAQSERNSTKLKQVECKVCLQFYELHGT